MLRPSTLRTLSLLLLCLGLACAATAQTPTAALPAVNASTVPAGEQPAAASDLEEIRRQLREQQSELERMRATINELRQRVAQSEQQPQQLPAAGAKSGEIAASDRLPNDASSNSNVAAGQKSTAADDRLKSVEEQTKKNTEAIARQLGSITFSGDLRLRYESLYGQLNALPNAANPSIIGNDLSTRQRFRIRARLNIRGQIGKEFDWGLRLGSGSYADAISNNQTLTDFYNRKPFS
ncbi:MAG TPA: putative porin, partial [Pyrinomonadaceae bacterium]